MGRARRNTTSVKLWSTYPRLLAALADDQIAFASFALSTVLNLRFYIWAANVGFHCWAKVLEMSNILYIVRWSSRLTYQFNTDIQIQMLIALLEGAPSRLQITANSIVYTNMGSNCSL